MTAIYLLKKSQDVIFMKLRRQRLIFSFWSEYHKFIILLQKQFETYYAYR